MPLEYYLALLQLHIAVIGVVIAGIVALVQLLNNSKPHRDISLLVRRPTLAAYGALLVSLMFILALGAWVSAFPGQARLSLGASVVDFYNDGRSGLVVIILTMTSLLWFALLALKTRELLDTQSYLRRYVQQTSARKVTDYLAAIYGDAPAGQPIPPDPFQPIREYTKDNAFKYYDYGTADGLKHFSNLFDKTLDDIKKLPDNHEDYVRVARYISESAVEFFSIFSKTISEKRKMDVISLLSSKGEAMLSTGNDASLLPIVRGLENIAKLSDDDDEIIAVINHIRGLGDIFLEHHSKHDWEHVAGPFDEICLSVTRISETYYLQKNNSLKTVPIIGFSTGEHQTVTAALVDFFCAYRDLAERYTDARPVSYFEAAESVIEVLFVRLRDIAGSGEQHIGFNMKYYEMARDLYRIYYDFGIDAIEHDKPELLTLALGNLRRVIKPARLFDLETDRSMLTAMIVELALKGIAQFDDIKIKGERTISDYAYETLSKHASSEQISEAMAALGNHHGLSDKDAEKTAVKKLITKLKSVS